MTKERRGIYQQPLSNGTVVRLIRECKSAWRWELLDGNGVLYFACRHFEATKPAALAAARLHSGDTRRPMRITPAPQPFTDTPTERVAPMQTLTTRLNSGVTVLARQTRHGVCAVTYANRTQAEAAAVRTGGAVIRPGFGRVFYVLLEATP